MNRYQVYLKPETVEIVDDLAKYLDLSRSQIIRDVLDRMAAEYQKVLAAIIARQNRSNPLLKMAGFAESTTGKVSQNVDEIYFRD